MPTYTYYCPKCDHHFELVMSILEVGKKTVSCPKCNTKKVQRVYTGFFPKTGRKS